MVSTCPGDRASRTRIENAVPHRHRLGLAAATLAALTTLAACGGEDGSAADPASTGGASDRASAAPSPDGSEGGGRGTASATPAPEADLAVEIAGDDISPNAAELEVGVGDSITVSVESDRAGELHVHSTPEQELAYEAGTSTLPLVIDQPGIVEVESHDLELVVVQLEVR
jgi:hypothetical protein